MLQRESSEWAYCSKDKPEHSANTAKESVTLHHTRINLYFSLKQQPLHIFCHLYPAVNGYSIVHCTKKKTTNVVDVV